MENYKMWTSDDKKKLLTLLEQVCKQQHAYGKKDIDAIETLKFYQLILEQHMSVSMVIEGLGKFLSRNRDLPHPSDINNIMNPVPEPLSPARYTQAVKRLDRSMGNFYEGRDDDKEYVAAFEANETRKVQAQKEQVPEIAQSVAKSLGYKS